MLAQAHAEAEKQRIEAERLKQERTQLENAYAEKMESLRKQEQETEATKQALHERARQMNLMSHNPTVPSAALGAQVEVNRPLPSIPQRLAGAVLFSVRRPCRVKRRSAGAATEGGKAQASEGGKSRLR